MPTDQRQALVLPVHVPPTSAPAQRYDPKYMVCCLHIKIVVILIGLFFAGLLCPFLFGALAAIFDSSSHSRRDGMIQLFVVILSIGCVASLFCGLKRKEKGLLIPFFIWQCLLCALLYWAALSHLGSLSNEPLTTTTYHREGMLTRQEIIVTPRSGTKEMLVFWTVAASLTAWWSHLVYRCYNFLEDFENIPKPSVSTTIFVPSAMTSQQQQQLVPSLLLSLSR